jgi:replicative DNA helicase
MKRTVPQSPATERAVLGSLIAEPNLVDEIAGLHADLFFTPSHRLIYETITEIRGEGGTPNLIATTQRIDAQHKLNFVGGAGALTELLSESAGGPAGVEYHAQTLRDLHARRRIIDASVAMQASAQDMAADADSVLQQAGEAVLSLSLTTATDSMRPASAIVPGLLDELEDLIANRTHVGLKTGFKDFDQVTGGLRGGQFVVIAGRPAMGKSALMMNMADNLAQRDVPVLYFSLEMPAQELASRVVLSRAKTNSELIRSGFLDHATKTRIADVALKFSGEPMYIDDRGGLSLLDVRGRARLAVRRWGVKAIFVDYLQLVSHAGAQSRENEVGFVSRGLKSMAMELNIPVIAAAQLNRKAEDRADHQPRMSDLRDSGQIEADADIVCLVHRPAYYSCRESGDVEPDPQDAILDVAKHRSGRNGAINMTWRPSLTRFDNSNKEAANIIPAPRLTDEANGVYAPEKVLWEALNE